MALTRVDTGLQSFPDFARNQQLANAQIYIGVPGLDPAVLANQYQAYIVQEDGTQVAVPQPIRTSAGGVPTYLGSPAQIGINEASYSFKVLNSLGSQIYYIPDSTDMANYATNASAVIYDPAGAGAVPTNVQTKLREIVSVNDFGAVGDSNIETGGGTDDTAAINAAISYCLSSGATLTSPPGKCYRITSAINMLGLEEIDWRGQIFADNINSGSAVTIGGFATGGSRKKFFFNEIHDGGSRFGAPTHALLRISGLKGGLVEVPACRYIELYSDDSVASTGSIGYNIFNFGHVYKIQLRGANSNSWVNENIFNGGRHSIINIGTTTTEFQHNHNVWTFPGLEGVIEINVQSGRLNRITNCRFEAIDVPGTQITFSTAADQNVISSVYDTDPSGSQFPWTAISPSRVSDAGQNNLVFKEVHLLYTKVPLFQLDARTPMLINGTPGDAASNVTANQRGLFDKNIVPIYGECVGLLPGLDYIKMSLTFRDIFTSDFIPVTPGDPFGIEFDVSIASIRYSIRCYDANFALLGAEGGGGAYLTGSSLTYDGAGKYSVNANLSSSDLQSTGAYGFAVRRSEVKYIRFTIGTGSATPLIRHVMAYFMEKPNSQPRPRIPSSQDTRQMTLPTIPTGGYVPRGTMVSKEDGASIYLCTFAYETTTNGALAGGATSVTVTTIGTVANGDVVGIKLDDGSTHWSTVSGLAGSTFTVSALPSAAANGSRIVFNRWATK